MKNDILDKPKVTSSNIFEVQIIESNEKDKTIMNWREGLARIWLILSILWISILFVMFARQMWVWNRTVGEAITELMNNLPLAVLLCFGPPLLLFILYKMVCWIIAGFRPNSSLDE